MAQRVVAPPTLTLATFIEQVTELTGDQVSRARQAGIFTMQDLIDAMCDPNNIRLLTDGSRQIDLALMNPIDDETSDVLENLAMSFTPRPANLTALVGPAGTGASPAVTTPVIPASWGYLDGIRVILSAGLWRPTK